MALRSYSRIIYTTLLFATLFLFASVIPVEAQGDAAAIERAAAQNFVPLVGIPYIQGDTVATFGDYVNAFYFAAISIAAFLAVVRIIFAGVKYMLSDIVTTKQEAKKDIRAALFGLLIVVGAVLILNTINSELTTIKLFTDAPVPSIGGNYVPPDPIRNPIAAERETCEARGAGYQLIVTRTVPEGESIRNAVMTTECCPPEGCTSTNQPTGTSTNQTSTTVTVLFEYPRTNLNGLGTTQRQEMINLWQTNCERTRSRDARNAARAEEIRQGLPVGTLSSNIAVVFVQESTPERYTCVQRQSSS